MPASPGLTQSTSRRAVMNRPCGASCGSSRSMSVTDEGSSPTRNRAADPVDPVVDQRGHLGTPLRVQTQTEQIGFRHLEQPGRADPHGKQCAWLTTADPFEPNIEPPSSTRQRWCRRPASWPE